MSYLFNCVQNTILISIILGVLSALSTPILLKIFTLVQLYSIH